MLARLVVQSKGHHLARNALQQHISLSNSLNNLRRSFSSLQITQISGQDAKLISINSFQRPSAIRVPVYPSFLLEATRSASGSPIKRPRQDEDARLIGENDEFEEDEVEEGEEKEIDEMDTEKLFENIPEEQLKKFYAKDMRPSSRGLTFDPNQMLAEVFNEKEEKRRNPYQDVEEEINPWDEDEFSPSSHGYKNLYLPPERIQQMIKSGFIKPVHEHDPLENEPIREEISKLSPSEVHILRKAFMRLEYAYAHPSKHATKSVWRIFPIIYERPHLASLLNDTAWKMIWDLDADDIPSPRGIFIGDLMLSVGATLREQQWIKYMESQFWNGQRERAFQLWSQGATAKAGVEWWNLGIRLYATENDIKGAIKVLDKLTTVKGIVNGRSFLPIIVGLHSYAEAAKEAGDTAKALHFNSEAKKQFKRMKAYIPLISQKHYLRVALSFLEFGALEDAFEIYIDMLSKYPDAIDMNATSQYWDWKASRYSINGEIPDLPNEEFDQLTEITLRTIPKQNKNPILLGNWIRNLIRRNRIEDALKVMRYMQMHGYILDTISYNDMIILLHEHGKVGMMSDLAARMIEKSIEIYAEENLPGGAATGLSITEPDLKKFRLGSRFELTAVKNFKPKPFSPIAHVVFADLVRDTDKIPPADYATFGLLMNRQIRTGNIANIQSIIRLLKMLKMRLDPYLFNPLLRMLLRRDELEKLWQTYRTVVSPENFEQTPDIVTFNILWAAMNTQSNRSTKEKAKFPNPRQLFNEMLQHSDKFTPSNYLYNIIIKCFYKMGDVVGAFSAMTGMAHVWGLYPGRIAIGNVVVGIAKTAGEGQLTTTRRHLLWALKTAAAEVFGDWILPPKNPPRQNSRQLKTWETLQRRKLKYLNIIDKGQDSTGSVGRKLENLRGKISKLEYYLKERDDELAEYWYNASPFDLEKSKEANDFVVGLSTIGKVAKEDSENSEEYLAASTHFLKNALFKGDWPADWWTEVDRAREEMGLNDEEGIDSRRAFGDIL